MTTRMRTRRRRSEPMTNQELVMDIMNKSRYGLLAEVFVIDALTKFSKVVADADVKDLDTQMMSGASWKGVAQEIHDKLANRE